jgi:hypothetical protein
MLLLALISCGGNSNRMQLSSGPVADSLIDVSLREGLPAIPDPGMFQLPRMTAAIESEARLNGMQSEQDQLTSINGTSRDFNSAPNAVAYALYRFVGAPGEAIDAVQVAASALSPGGTIYVALGNYATNRWQFFTPSTSLTSDYPFPVATSDYTSPVSGSIFVLVAVYGGDTATIDSVALNFTTRFGISGTVQDIAGNGIQGVVMSVGILGQMAITDANGNFTLGGLPDGNWMLYATASSYTFYSNPQLAVVAGGNVSGMLYIGHQTASNFLPRDPLGPNNDFYQANDVDLEAGPISDSLSVVDDRNDFFRFTVNTPGSYVLQFSDQDHNLVYPSMTLYNQYYSFINSNGSALSGALCVPFTTYSVPATYVVQVSCNAAGGGDYELSLIPSGVSALSGTVSTIVFELGGAELLVTEDGSGLETIYTMSPFAGPGSTYGDWLRRNVDATVVPISDSYTYAPTSINAALSGGDVMNADFLATVVPIGDSYEPNPDALAADANGALALPYNSDGNDDLSFGNTDAQDWYRVEPAAGQGLRAVIDFGDYREDAASLFIVWNDGFSVLANGEKFNNRLTAILPSLTDGGHYYIGVATLGSQMMLLPYTMRIETFTAREVIVRTDFDGQPIGGALVDLRDDQFGHRRSSYTDTLGETFPFICEQGSDVFVEIFRWGMDFDRQTRRITVPNADSTHVFEASSSLSLDSYEPNDDFTAAPTLPALPTSVYATLDPATDFTDNYKIQLTSNDPVGLTVNGLPGDTSLTVVLYDDVLNFVTVLTLNNGRTVFFDPMAINEYTLQLFGGFPDIQYGLDIHQEPAFTISGSSLDDIFLNPVLGNVLYIQETDTRIYPDGAGLYESPLLAPGTYTIETWAPGYIAPPPSVLTITNTGLVENFLLTLDPGADNYEPMNDAPPGVLLPADGTLSLPNTIGVGGDLNDYFNFQGFTGKIYIVRLEWAQPWYYDAYILDVSSPSLVSMGNSFNFGLGFQELSFLAPEDGLYTILVPDFGPAEYQVRITEL